MRSSACSRRSRDGRWVMGLVRRANHLLHLAPRAARARFARGAVAKRSKSGAGRSHRLRLAESVPSHPVSFATLGIRPLPARGERWSMLQRLRDDQFVPVALAAFSKSSITPLPTREAISV